MEKLFELIIAAVFKLCICGMVYFRTLAYIEGHPIGTRIIRRIAVVPVSIVISLLSGLILRNLAALGAHPLAEAFAAAFLAALLASATSGILLLCSGRKSRRVRQKEASSAEITILRHQMPHAG